MKLPFALIGLSAVLAGCNGAVSPTPVSGIAPQSARQSWMARDAGSQSLLYVSNSETATVDVYKNFLTKNVTLVGKLTGFEYPYGECTDATGDVYITDYYKVDIVEYAHGGTSPLRTLTLTGSPIGCAVDPTSGNLAVAIWEGAQGYNSSGGVFIFRAGTGKPTLYTISNLFQIWPPAYDPHGNLFLLGYNPTVELVELPRGAGAFRQISLGTLQINAPGSVLWEGRFLDAVDLQYQGGNTTAVYRLRIKGTNAAVVHTTVLTDTCSGNFADVVQPLIVKRKIFGPNQACKYRYGFWSDAAGGNPKRTFSSSIAPLDGSGSDDQQAVESKATL